jgi:hypothetical protein
MRFLPMLLCAGCIAGMGYTTRDRATLAAREYNEGVRWGKLDQAGQYVPKAERERFFDRHKRLEDDLQIVDSEVIQLDVDKSDKKHDRATVRVEYTWTLRSTGLVEKTTTLQKWEEDHGDWTLRSETRTKGTPLTLFAEPPKTTAEAQ